MSIRNQQIGWSQESKLWWEVLKGFNKLEQTIASQYGKRLLVDNAQIGWRNEEYLLREIAKKIAAITALRCTDKCPPTTTSTTTPVPPCTPIVEKEFRFVTEGDSTYFFFSWGIVGAIDQLNVDWGDGTPVEVFPVASLFQSPFTTFRNYSTTDIRTVTVSFSICEANDLNAFYNIWLRSSSPFNVYNSILTNNVNCYGILINTLSPTFTFDIGNCTKLSLVSINADYNPGDTFFTTVNTLDVSMSNVMESLQIQGCTINTLILSPIALWNFIILEDPGPLDVILNQIMIASDNAGQINGSFLYTGAGVLDPLGDAAKLSLQGKGWSITPP